MWTASVTQLAGFTPMRFSCIKLDPSVVIDNTTTPSIIKAIAGPPSSTRPCEPYYGVFSESPIGVVDGINVVFTLSASPINGSQLVVVDGSVRTMGIDWTTGPSGNQITFTVAPPAGAVIRVYYRA